MSPPIYTPDGNEVTKIVLPDGSTASEVVAPDGSVVFDAGPEIPDSVVVRSTDENSNSKTAKLGVRIRSSVEWQSIGAEISSMVSGVTTAYMHRVSDGELMGQTDISGLVAGDVFTVDGVNLQPYDGTSATEYNFVLDDGSNSYTAGFKADAAFPFDSSDGNLSIINGAEGSTGTNPGAVNLLRVGNVGFS